MSALPTPPAPIQDLAYLQGVAVPMRITEGLTNREMSKILKEASAETDAFLAKTLGSKSFSVAVAREQQKAIQAGMDAISTELWSRTGKVIQVGMFQQAALAADQALDRDLFLGMPGQAALQYTRAMHLDAASGVESILSRRTNGFKLADRIYAHGAATTAQVGRIVEVGLARQLSARQIAAATRMHFDPMVPGGTSYASMRLARTEINNAHHETTIRQSDQRPWVLGFHWNLSESHPRPDDCNLFAERDDYNMGAGNYPQGNAPSRPHPQCLCYLTHVQEDEEEFANKLLKGNYDSWLNDRRVTCSGSPI